MPRHEFDWDIQGEPCYTAAMSDNAPAAPRLRRLYGVLLTLGIACIPLLAQTADIELPGLPSTGARLGDFIPPGWRGIDTAFGDLDKDGRDDCALIIEYVPPPSPDPDHDPGLEENPRILAALLATPTGYRLSCQANRLVLMKTEGGVLGDPLDHLEIERGSIVIGFFGGSREKWNVSYRFRYQDGGWFMIGATSGGGNGLHSFLYDFNLLTGKIEAKIEDDEQPKRNRRWTKRVKLPKLPRMEEFAPWTLEIDREITF